MMIRRKTVLALALCIVSGGPAIRGARAQETTAAVKAGEGGEAVKAVNAKKGKKKKKKKKSKQEPDPAEAYHQQAMQLYKKGMYKEAIEYFKKANEILPNPFSLYNIARCHEKLGEYPEAWQYYKKYLSTGDQGKRKEAQDAVARIESTEAAVEIVTTPEGADVIVDGEPVPGQVTPLTVKVKAGSHAFTIKKEGHNEAVKELDLVFGESRKIDIFLVTKEVPPRRLEEKTAKVKKKIKTGLHYIESFDESSAAARPAPPISLGLAAGATASTDENIGSYIDASLSLTGRIGRFSVGAGIDNMFFVDSYLMAGYPLAGYSVKVWKGLSLELAAGLGFVWLHAAEEGGDGAGNIVVEKGDHFDLMVHCDVKLSYAVGRVRVQVVPLHADILTGVGGIGPAPLAQFAFLLGVTYDWGKM